MHGFIQIQEKLSINQIQFLDLWYIPLQASGANGFPFKGHQTAQTQSSYHFTDMSSILGHSPVIGVKTSDRMKKA